MLIRRLRLAIAMLGLAASTPSAVAGRPQLHTASACAAGESAVYACAAGRDEVLVCAGDHRVTYRYGPANAPRLVISSNGRDGVAHQSGVNGGGHGFETYIRFSHLGFDYIVFSSQAGEYSDVPGRRFSGVTVVHGDNEHRNLVCHRNTPAQIISAPEFIAQEDDPNFQRWY